MPPLHPAYAEVLQRAPDEVFTAVYAPSGLIALESRLATGGRRRHYVVTPDLAVMTCAPQVYLDTHRKLAALWPDHAAPQEVAR